LIFASQTFGELAGAEDFSTGKIWAQINFGIDPYLLGV
jgi:hypothetical protein